MEINQAHKDAIDLERGRAIDAFSKMESALCWILKEAAHLELHTAATIFYSNISLQPRVEVVSAILEESCGNTFNVFWESVRKAIDSLNKQRNKIIHWHSYPCFEGEELKNKEFILLHPIIKDEKLSKLSIHDIRHFIEKTEYLAGVLNRFRGCFESSMKALQRRDIEIFSSNDFKFPPPANDPFASK